MYLPRWATAALAVFNAVSDPAGVDSSDVASVEALGSTIQAGVKSYFFYGPTTNQVSFLLNVTKPEKGGVAVLSPAGEELPKGLWDLITWPYSRDSYLLRLHTTNLCLATNTTHVKEDGEEWDEPSTGPVKLKQCPKVPDPDKDDPPDNPGLVWLIRDLKPIMSSAEFISVFVTLFYETGKTNLTAAEISEDEWERRWVAVEYKPT